MTYIRDLVSMFVPLVGAAFKKSDCIVMKLKLGVCELTSGFVWEA